jgi:N,N'-diacetyllegionaminate synthase
MAVELVAEIAQGYEGNPKLAELLVKGALAADADAVKIQLIFADELAVSSYQYYDLFKSLEMDISVWQKLGAMIREKNKKFYLDIYGDKSLQWARELGATGVKISTTDFYNTALLKKAFATFERVFLSVGGIPVEDLDEVMSTIVDKNKVVLMHGFQAEPTEAGDNNIRRISTLRDRYKGAKLGFMDHARGDSDEAFYLPLLALGQGVEIIEKHISLDQTLEIEDYISALSIDRFKQFVKIVRLMEPSLGSAELVLTEKEIAYKNRAGKVVVANRDLASGVVLTDDDLAFKRVSAPDASKFFKRASVVVGKKLKTALGKDKPFEIDQLG